MSKDMSCLYSTVRNTSGGRKKFGFLPPHGRELTVNEEYTVFGDIKQAIIRFERTEARRNIIAFENALRRGDISIINTPNPIMHDEKAETTKMLTYKGGAIGYATPCWLTETSLSSSDTEV